MVEGVVRAGQLSGEPALLAKALAMAQAIGTERHRAPALAAVAGQLSGEPALLEQALAAVQTLKEGMPRTRGRRWPSS